MNGQENGLPRVQFFYREGRPLRAVEFLEEIWLSAADVMNHLGHDGIDGSRAVSLLKLLGIACRTIPCIDGAEKIYLWCITESSLMRMLDKIEQYV
jgi:prophage antirepressor-like protein